MTRQEHAILLKCLRWIFRKELWHAYVQLDDNPPVRMKMGRHDWHIDYTADPFLFRYDGVNWLLYETLDKKDKGVLGVFKEEHGRWKNWGKVLERACHLSYPQVFEDNGKIYMIPESSDEGRGKVDLYESTNFPSGWKFVKTLIKESSVDSTLVRKGGYYYLFCNVITSPNRAELWFAPSLLGPWEKHPQAMNINQSFRLRRNGGAFLEIDGKLHRVAQDCNGAYGKRLFAVPVLELSSEKYKEGPATLLLEGRLSEFKNGRHTYNEINDGNHKIRTFDVQDFHLRPIHRMIANICFLIGRRVLPSVFAGRKMRP